MFWTDTITHCDIADARRWPSLRSAQFTRAARASPALARLFEEDLIIEEPKLFVPMRLAQINAAAIATTIHLCNFPFVFLKIRVFINNHSPLIIG
jgi:hypothetical protein